MTLLASETLAKECSTSCRIHQLPNIVYEPADDVSRVEPWSYSWEFKLHMVQLLEKGEHTLLPKSVVTIT
jgi:hypothetical protein